MIYNQDTDDKCEFARLAGVVLSKSLESSLLSWVKHRLGLDRAIVFAVLTRGWSSSAGLVTLLLIARFLSLAEQGYYYTFGSLVALQIVFELGFSFVVLQMASHERAHLQIAVDGSIAGDVRSHGRLASVLQKSVKWYMVAATLMFCGLLPAGLYFFSRHAQQGIAVSWRVPWLLVVLAATLTFQIDPLFAFLEGCGYVPEVARTRFWQVFCGSLMAWTALIAHHGLYAPSMVILGQALAGGGWLWTRRRLLFGLLRHTVGEHRIAWFTEVWPFQWRIAVSWISGYFIFQLFNPVLFAYWGPVAAGQMGMSLAISTAIMSIGVSWISTKAAPFGVLIARRQWAELDQMFFHAVSRSWLVCVALCITAFAGNLYIHLRGFKLAHRLLDPGPFGVLLLTIIVNHLVFSEAIYMRAHKQEKFLVISVASAICMTGSTYFLGRAYGASGMVVGYFVINAVIGLGFGTSIFFKYRRIWHAD